MNGRSDDIVAMGAIAAGAGIAAVVTLALLAAPRPSAPSAPAVPPPHAVPSAPEAPAPPPAIRFRPPVDHAPIPDLTDERTVLRLTLIPDYRHEEPASIRHAVISAHVAGDDAEAPHASPLPGAEVPARAPGGG